MWFSSGEVLKNCYWLPRKGPNPTNPRSDVVNDKLQRNFAEQVNRKYHLSWATTQSRSLETTRDPPRTPEENLATTAHEKKQQLSFQSHFSFDSLYDVPKITASTEEIMAIYKC